MQNASALFRKPRAVPAVSRSLGWQTTYVFGLVALTCPRGKNWSKVVNRLSTLVLAAGLVHVTPVQAVDLSYLQGLLAATPQGGWVKANTNRYSDAWATAAQGGLPDSSGSSPASIVTAWSSVAWDNVNGQLLLWGGGHANYMGNEIYAWNGSTGAWDRGSLPSRLDRYGSTSTYFAADDAAPQSSHTYDNNVFAPINGMFVTFGGAAYNSGGAFTVRDANGNPVAAGPWAWDPLKADPNKVGGTTGSGYIASTPGGEMWTNLRGEWTGGGPGADHVNGTTAYRSENGRDVIYVTSNPGGSGWQNLYRYELGDVRNGGIGSFQQVGVSNNAPSFQSAAAIDSLNNLYIQTSAVGTAFRGFSVWDLNQNNAARPSSNQDRYISLIDDQGAPVPVSTLDGISFDEATGKILLWDGKDRGTVWETKAKYVNGQLAGTWLATKRVSSTAAQPTGQFVGNGSDIGVLGKWQYVAELDAFIALDSIDPNTADAGVWLYKPFATAVPEPGTYALWLAGLGVLGWIGRRRSA